MIDLEAIQRGQNPSLTAEHTAVLKQLCLYHEKGFGAYQATVKSWSAVIVLASCLVVSACLVIFANQIPSFYSTLFCGLFSGSLITATRYRLALQRQWPLLDAIIDWKLADRIRREVVMLDDPTA